MNATVESENNGADLFKWVIVFAILIGAVVGNSMFGEISVVIRALAIVFAVAIAGFTAAQTNKGRQFLVFAKESRTEVRKVVWPTRQETMHTTAIIMVATAVMAVVLWGIDTFLFWAVGAITGLEI